MYGTRKQKQAFSGQQAHCDDNQSLHDCWRTSYRQVYKSPVGYGVYQLDQPDISHLA